MSRIRSFTCSVLLCASALGGCGSTAPDLDQSVRDPARRGYYDGMRELLDADYLEAAKIFQVVAASPRTSKYAGLAKLRLGDTLFAQGRYAEASEIYRGFTNQYKSDPNLPYARFKVAACYYERLPSEWFATPPAHEMDQTVTQQAEAELKGFLNQFSTSRFAPEARKMLAETRGMLFDAEMYAVDFYADRDKWQAVAWRLADAMNTYPELAVRDGRVWQLVQAWDKVGDRGETAKALGLYLEKFPNGEHKDEARARLEAIRQAVEAERAAPPVDKAPAPEPEPTPDTEPEPELEPETEPPSDDDGETTDDDELKLRPPTAPPLEPEE